MILNLLKELIEIQEIYGKELRHKSSQCEITNVSAFATNLGKLPIYF